MHDFHHSFKEFFVMLFISINQETCKNLIMCKYIFFYLLPGDIYWQLIAVILSKMHQYMTFSYSANGILNPSLQKVQFVSVVSATGN